MKKVFLIMFILFLVLCFTACGRSSSQVPDSELRFMAEDCPYLDSDTAYVWNAEHNLDRAAHTDTIELSVTMDFPYGTVSADQIVQYQYNRTTDLWTLHRRGEWADPHVDFHRGLCGVWQIEKESPWEAHYEINIKSVSEDEATVEYSVQETAFSSSWPQTQRNCSLSGAGVFSLTQGWDFSSEAYLVIPAELPDGFFAAPWMDTFSHENETTIELHITINLYKGVVDCYVYPGIYYLEPETAATEATDFETALSEQTPAPSFSIVSGDRGRVVPERDTPLTLDDFYGTTMIGNSFVEGMQLWSDIEKIEYICADGVSLDNMIGNYLYFVTVRSYSSIYLTLGINEIGWPVDSFISKYEKVIDYIRSDAYSPHATIYITSLFPVEETCSTISLETILEFNEALKEMCQRKGCWYLDVYSALANSRGYLPADVAADDHVHFEKTGYRIWTDYLLNHYVDESLLEGN